MQDQVFSRNTINYVFFPVLTIKHCNTWRKCRAEENCNIIPKSATVLVAVQKCSEAKEMILILLTEEWMGFLRKAEKKKQPSIFFLRVWSFVLIPCQDPALSLRHIFWETFCFKLQLFLFIHVSIFSVSGQFSKKIRFNWHGHAWNYFFSGK